MAVVFRGISSIILQTFQTQYGHRPTWVSGWTYRSHAQRTDVSCPLWFLSSIHSPVFCVFCVFRVHACSCISTSACTSTMRMSHTLMQAISVPYLLLLLLLLLTLQSQSNPKCILCYTTHITTCTSHKHTHVYTYRLCMAYSPLTALLLPLTRGWFS